MTGDQRRQFEAQWPALAARLHQLLARKRTPPWQAEDIVQETGLRLIRTWTEIDQTKPLWPLTVTIALNVMRDEFRKHKEMVRDVPDTASQEDVEARGIARVELGRVGGAMSRLTADQRDVLVGDVVGMPSTHPDPSALRMLRMRARRRLQQLVDHASMLGISAGVQLRRAVREAEIIIGKLVQTDAEHVPGALLGIAAALGVGAVLLPGGVLPGATPHEITQTGRPPAAVGSGGAISGGIDSRITRASIDDVGIVRPGAGVSRTDATGKGGSTPTGDDEGTNPHNTTNSAIPRSTDYLVRLSDETFVRGELELEVEHGFDPAKERTSPGSIRPGSIGCSVAPSDTGASCSHTGSSLGDRGARVRHHTEVWVQGERIL